MQQDHNNQALRELATFLGGKMDTLIALMQTRHEVDVEVSEDKEPVEAAVVKVIDERLGAKLDMSASIAEEIGRKVDAMTAAAREVQKVDVSLGDAVQGFADVADSFKETLSQFDGSTKMAEFDAGLKELLSQFKTVTDKLTELQKPDTSVSQETNKLVKELIGVTKKIKLDVPEVDLSPVQALADRIDAMAGEIKKLQEKDSTTAIVEAVRAIRFEIPQTFRLDKDQLAAIVYSGRGSGGIGGVQEEQMDELITAVSGSTDDEVLVNIVDSAGVLTYIGYAVPGTASSAPSWRIKRIDETNDPDVVIKWAGTGAFDQVWDNRVGLTYN